MEKKFSLSPGSNLIFFSTRGIHLATYLFSEFFYPSLLTSRQNVIVRGAVFISVPFDYENASESDLTIMKEYYGSLDNAACFSPVALRRKCAGALPDQLNVLAEKDPDDVICRPVSKKFSSTAFYNLLLRQFLKLVLTFQHLLTNFVDLIYSSIKDSVYYSTKNYMSENWQKEIHLMR